MSKTRIMSSSSTTSLLLTQRKVLGIHDENLSAKTEKSKTERTNAGNRKEEEKVN